MTTRTHFVIAPVLSASVVFSGCCSSTRLSQSPTAKTQDEIGTVMVFAQPAVPWTAYKDSLKANFSLNAQTALAEVLPLTSARRDAQSSAVRFQVQAGLPTAAHNRVTTTATAADGSQARTINDVLTEATAAAPAAAALPVAATMPEYSAPSESLRVDPILRYYAATALNQEVQILNKYLESLDKLSSRYEAYVVRLQVSLQPRRRDWAYDAYTDVVFSTQQFDDPKLPAIALKPAPASDSVRRKAATGPEAAAVGEPAPGAYPRNSDPERIPPNLVVLPMLVTDSVEAMLRQRSAEQLRELGVTLSGMVQGIGVGANAGNTFHQLEELLGKDLNSTLTVGRLDRDSIRVRFGAQHQGRDDFAIVPRNHTVTALVLVAKPYVYKKDDTATATKEASGPGNAKSKAETSTRQAYALIPSEGKSTANTEATDTPRPNLYAFSTTSFVHARDGSIPPYKSAEKLVDDLIAKLENRGASKASIADFKKCLPQLVDARLAQNRPQFRATIAQLQRTVGTSSAIIGDWLWTDLSSWRSKLGISNEEILVVDSPRAPYNSELPATIERSKEAVRVMIEFGRHAINNIDDVQLQLDGAGPQSARTLRVRDDGSALIAEFPLSVSRILPTIATVTLDGPRPDNHQMPTVKVGSITGWPKLPSAAPALLHVSEGSKHTLVTLPGTSHADSATGVVATLVDGSNRYPAIAVGAGENGRTLTSRFALPEDGAKLGSAPQLELSGPDFGAGTFSFAVHPGPAPEVPKAKKASIKLATNQVARTKDFTAKIAFTFEIAEPAAGAPVPPVRVALRGAVIHAVTPSAAGAATLENGQIRLAGTGGFVVVDLVGISDPEITVAVLEDKAVIDTKALKVIELPATN